MRISEQFVLDLLKDFFPVDFQSLYDNSKLLQYLDKKMKAVHGNSKTRRSLASIYAIYSLLHFYVDDYYNKPEEYKAFTGYDYMRLFNFYRSLYGGSKLQNHALNSRVNGEFKNKVTDVDNDLIMVNNGSYFLHISHLYVNGTDISKCALCIIEKYVELLIQKDNALIAILAELSNIDNYDVKKEKINSLLTEDSEARIFEIISYAILRNHYKNVTVYFGYEKDKINEYKLTLFKTGRTNANDGGIDFVMRPVGRFFQVTEVNNYDKYLLDIDKIMRFPITFVIKTHKLITTVQQDLNSYIELKSGGMDVIRKRYRDAVEEIITINELRKWTDELKDCDIDSILRDIDIYYRLEMNLDAEEEEDVN